MNIEVLGTIATLFVLASFLVSGEKRIRIINIIGAALFVVYGYLMVAHSVYILNGILCMVHIYKLIKNKKTGGKLC